MGRYETLLARILRLRNDVRIAMHDAIELKAQSINYSGLLATPEKEWAAKKATAKVKVIEDISEREAELADDLAL
jgi:hypothetical protein